MADPHQNHHEKVCQLNKLNIFILKIFNQNLELKHKDRQDPMIFAYSNGIRKYWIVFYGLLNRISTFCRTTCGVFFLFTL
jgi:hypothetical protein